MVAEHCDPLPYRFGECSRGLDPHPHEDKTLSSVAGGYPWSGRLARFLFCIQFHGWFSQVAIIPESACEGFFSKKHLEVFIVYHHHHHHHHHHHNHHHYFHLHLHLHLHLHFHHLHHIFIISSSYFHHIFIIFTLSSSYFHYFHPIFTISSSYPSYLHHTFIKSSSYTHHIFIISSPSLHISSSYLHQIFIMSIPYLRHIFIILHHIFITYGPRKAVAEVSNHKEPIGKRCAGLMRESNDVRLTRVAVQMAWLSNDFN